MDALLADGLPGPREEAWEVHPLRALERRAFAAADPVPPAIDASVLAGIPAPRLVFDQRPPRARAQRHLAGLPDGVVLEPLSRTLAEGEPRDVNFILRRYDQRSEAFSPAPTPRWPTRAWSCAWTPACRSMRPCTWSS